MAAFARAIPVNLNNRRLLLISCFCLLVAFLVFQFGFAFTFVIASVVSVALLWYFWTETWFAPSETRVTVSSSTGPGKYAKQEETGTLSLSDSDRQRQQEHGPLYQQNIDEDLFKIGRLVRKPLRAKRTNPYSNTFVHSNIQLNANMTSSTPFGYDKTRERRRHRQVFSPITGSGNLTFAALTGNPNSNKSFTSRENMSFSSSFLYSPSKHGSPNICHTNHRHYPTHQPEYSGLGQLPIVRWNDTDSPVWKRRTSMQSPVMVKIAPPDTVRSESPLLQSVVDDKEEEKSDPCKKESVIAAIRECRKRGVDDKDDSSSTASLSWEQGNKRRRLDENSRSNTPSVASSSEYDTAPPSRAESTVSSLNSNIPGPKGILSRTPRNAIISSLSSSRRIQKRKHVQQDDDDETDFSPIKKPALGLDATSKEMEAEDAQPEEMASNGNKENQPETPKRTPSKRGQERDDAEDESDKSLREENRTPRKRSLRELLAKQKTPLRLHRTATKLMTNSPGQYTAADLAEDRYMARQRVNYIKEALKDPEPPPSTTGPTTATSTSTSSSSSTASLGSSQTTTNTTTSLGLLSALSKPLTNTVQPTLSLATPTTKPSVTPTLSLAAGAGASKTNQTVLSGSSAPSVSLVTTPGLSTSTSQVSSSQTNTQASSFFAGLSSTVKSTLNTVPSTPATTTSVPLSLSVSKPPPYSGTQAAASSVLTTPLATTTLPNTMKTTSGLLPGVQTNAPTSRVNLLSQQIKSQDTTNTMPLSGFQVKPQTSVTSAPLQTTTPFNFGTKSTSANSLMSNSITSSAPATRLTPASSSSAGSSIFNTSILNTPATQQSTPQSGSKSTFAPLFPSAANTTTAQTSAPSLNFSGNTAATSSSSASFKPIFNAQTQSASKSVPSTVFSANNQTTKSGGFQFSSSTTTSSNQAQASGVFQFQSTNNQTTAASTASSQPATNLFAFGAQNNPSNPSPFGATSMPGQTKQTSIFSQTPNPSQSQNQTQVTFGAPAKPFSAPSSQATASPFGGSGINTSANPNPFGGTTQQQPQNIFGAAPQPTENPFGATNQQQAQNPFGSASQSQNAFGASTQPAGSTGVFTFGANNNKPSTGGITSSGFNFGAAAQPSAPTANSGFNFSSAASSSGFNFGQTQQQQQQPPPQQPAQSSSGSGMFQFGQRTPGPAATPQPFATPTNTQPFNFTGGATPGFGSAPSSGRSTPVGSFSVGASSGTSSAAQRRARMRQARGRSGRR